MREFKNTFRAIFPADWSNIQPPKIVLNIFANFSTRFVYFAVRWLCPATAHLSGRPVATRHVCLFNMFQIKLACAGETWSFLCEYLPINSSVSRGAARLPLSV